MKTRIVLLLGFVLSALVVSASAQDQKATDPSAELTALVARIQAKIRAGKTAAELAPEAADFAALRAKSGGQDPELAAKIAYLEYTFQLDVLKDRRAAMELRKELETKHRKYLAGTSLGREFEMQKRSEQARAAQADLVGQPAPELNFIWSSREGLTRLSALRGKVVVLDFWATWCGPCVATFPQIRELAEHYKDADVIVLGVTSLQGYVAGLTPPRIDTKGDAQKEFAATSEFIKAKQMTWPVVFTDERVFNPHYSVTGIPHMAIIAPDGTVRHNGLHPGMPHADKLQKIDQILMEFGKTKSARTSGE
ncbi:MAG: TlpA disulfide reductase family protein [Opitutaceae bacterium]|nr:TlpA disulfide reductase family protein [Opitutaceae bacterium]